MSISNGDILESVIFFLKMNESDEEYNNRINNYDQLFFKDVIDHIPMSLKYITQYNDIAYYLEQAKKYKESIFILNQIIEKYPNRTVAYINLGDTYWGLKDTDNAKQAYKKYIELMKANNKEQRIPKRIYERVAQED